MTANIKRISGNRWRGINLTIEFIHAQYVEFVCIFNDRCFSITASKVNAIRNTHRRSIKTGRATQSLLCIMNFSGEIHYAQERLSGSSGFYASPVGVSDRVYLAGRNGKTTVIENADELNVLSVNELDGEIDSSPAVSGNALYIRSHDHLYCIAE